MEHPKLRPGLEAIPITHEGREFILLRDRMGYGNASLVISPALLRLVARMNGELSITGLQRFFFEGAGETISREKLEEIVNRLDEHHFLENERFLQLISQIESEFRGNPIRRMTHAGQSYPAEPEALRRTLDEFFKPENGGPGSPRPNSPGPHILGLVAPHIDIQAGGPCFAHAYKAQCEAKSSPDVWVVLGTGHEPVANYFALTAKHFETPIGVVRYDEDFCRKLAERAPRDILASECNHRQEHVIEFQAVFLAHVQPEARIVPLLCSFSTEEWETDREYIDGMAALLRELADERSGKVGFIASVDLAHVGPRYGGRVRPDEGVISEHMRADSKLLEIIEKCDAAGFIRAIHKEDNRRNVCGVAPLYVLAKVLEGRAEGRLLHHAYTPVDQHNSFVTFASIAFEEKPL
ncbi:MAG: AmmeMemoRadiSam system protein B [Syntrophobacteraceae bacterium]